MVVRKKIDLIQLLHELYHGHQWEEMEEYFEVAYVLFMLHGAKFIGLEEVKDTVREEIFDAEVNDPKSKYYGINRGVFYTTKLQDHFDSLFEHSFELRRLCKFSDSEEAWREEINAGPDDIEYFTSICNKFLIFKYL